MAATLSTGRLQKMNRRFIIITEELMSRIHDVHFIADKSILCQGQGRDHRIF